MILKYLSPVLIIALGFVLCIPAEAQGAAVLAAVLARSAQAPEKSSA
ncbi:MAG: hypothetical protein WBV46_09295 [Terriglobales bacterium]